MVHHTSNAPLKKRKCILTDPSEINTLVAHPAPYGDDLQLTHVVKYSNRVANVICKPFSGNSDDKVLDAGSLAYSLQGIDSWTSRVLYKLDHKYMSDIIFKNSGNVFSNGVVVKVDDEGRSSPYFIPDFADLAMLPLSLKIGLKHWFKSGTKIPEKVKKIIESCGPSLPLTRPCCRLDRGIESWKCYSNASKVQLMEVANPEFRIVSVVVECKKVSTSHLDGRKYRCTIHSTVDDTSHPYKYNKPKLTFLLWNCQGIGRPSFSKHLRQLLHDHNPNIIVLLETRGAKMKLHNVLRDMKVHRIDALSTDDYYGGAIVLSMRIDVTFANFKYTEYSNEILHGFVNGIW